MASVPARLSPAGPDAPNHRERITLHSNGIHRPVKHSVTRIIGRYVSGRPLDGYPRTDSTFFRAGTRTLTISGRASRWSNLPGHRRAAVRLGVPAALVAVGAAYVTHPTMTVTVASSAAAVAAYRGGRSVRRRFRTRRLRQIIVRPAARIVGPWLGINAHCDPEKWLRVSPDLAGLAPKLARPMSPFETRTRELYAEHAEPYMRYLPDQTMRAWWAIGDRARPYLEWTQGVRRPADDSGPCIEIRAPEGVLIDDELATKIRKALGAKFGLDLTESWDQVGPQARGRYRVRERPPSSVVLADIRAALRHAADHEIVLGIAAGNRPVIVSLDDDAPHIGLSAGSGAGKSVFAMTAAGQILARGGRVVILDTKGSHRWARGIPGVTVCMDIADIHAALLGIDKLATERNREAFIQPDGWDPGERVFVVFEEMNATIALLRSWWAEVRDQGDPKICPSIAAYRRILFTGRSAKVNLLAIAQMLTGNASGGPEARENLGIRALARYSANNWKMLAPECPMPKKSRVRGRWQIVVAGVATECQVAYLTAADVAELAAAGQGFEPPSESARPVPPPVPDDPDPADWPPAAYVPAPGVPDPRQPAETTGTGDTGDRSAGAALVALDGLADGHPVTLREALDRGIVTGGYETVKKRLQRAGADGPPVVGRDGNANTYRPEALRAWAADSLIGN